MAGRLSFDQECKQIISKLDKAITENRKQQTEIEICLKACSRRVHLLNDETPEWSDHTNRKSRLVFPVEEVLHEIYTGAQRLWRNRTDNQLLEALRKELQLGESEDVHQVAESRIDSIDWAKVASQIAGFFDAQETKNRYITHLHPSANTDCWTKDEELLLLTVTEKNPTDWTEVAEALGTNRTGFQVFKHFRQSLSNLLHSEWTPEQDMQLREVAERDKVSNGGRINWFRVSSQLERRSSSQCLHRYEMTHGSSHGSKDPWTEEETERLFRLHRIFGPKWRKISEFLPNRNEMQIRNHFMHHSRPEQVEECTTEEAALLIELIRKHGPGDWVRIASEIPGRDGKWARKMFQRLMPAHNEFYVQLLARSAYCSLPKNVSSSKGRANRRPKITPLEFSVPGLPSFDEARTGKAELLYTGHGRTDRILERVNRIHRKRNKPEPEEKVPAMMIEDGVIEEPPERKRRQRVAVPDVRSKRADIEYPANVPSPVEVVEIDDASPFEARHKRRRAKTEIFEFNQPTWANKPEYISDDDDDWHDILYPREEGLTDYEFDDSDENFWSPRSQAYTEYGDTNGREVLDDIQEALSNLRRVDTSSDVYCLSDDDDGENDDVYCLDSETEPGAGAIVYPGTRGCAGGDQDARDPNDYNFGNVADKKFRIEC